MWSCKNVDPSLMSSGESGCLDVYGMQSVISFVLGWDDRDLPHTHTFVSEIEEGDWTDVVGRKWTEGSESRAGKRR